MSGIIGGAGSKSGVIGTTELDYEEGEWTPAPGTGSFSGSGYYTKIGNTVVVSFGSTSTNGGGDWSGFPFAPSTTAARHGYGVISYHNHSAGDPYTLLIESAGFSVRSGSDQITFSSGRTVRGGATYMTDA